MFPIIQITPELQVAVREFCYITYCYLLQMIFFLFIMKQIQKLLK